MSYSLSHVSGSGGHVDPRRWPKSEHRPIPSPTPSADAPVCPHRNPGSLRSCAHWSTPPPTRCCCSPISRSLSLSLPPTIDCRPCSLIMGTLFSQMTIESTSRDPSTAAEFTLLHAARCKLRHDLPNLFPCPSFCRGYVRLMIHSRISPRALRLD